MPDIYGTGSKVFVEGENTENSIPLGEDNLGVVQPGTDVVVGDVELNVIVEGNSGSVDLAEFSDVFVEGASVAIGTFENMPFLFDNENNQTVRIRSVERNEFDFVTKVIIEGLRFGIKTVTFIRNEDDKITLVTVWYNGAYNEYTPVYSGLSIISWI
jgi:hypothetical protein